MSVAMLLYTNCRSASTKQAHLWMEKLATWSLIPSRSRVDRRKNWSKMKENTRKDIMNTIGPKGVKLTRFKKYKQPHPPRNRMGTVGDTMRMRSTGCNTRKVATSYTVHNFCK